MKPSLAGRAILITGGTGGAGLEVARVLHEYGAEVILGTRDAAHYATAAASLDKGGAVHPFIADLTDPRSIERGLGNLELAGVDPTDVIQASAGGMEPLMRLLMRRLVGLRKVPPHELGAATAALREELGPIVAGTRDRARLINQRGPAQLLDQLVPRLPSGGTVIFYSSLWASHWPHPQVPVYYEAVAEGKRALEQWLEARAPAWSQRGVTTAVVSANLITGTRMGYLLDRFCTDLMPATESRRMRAGYLTCADLAEATIRILDGRERPRAGEDLLWLWLPGPGRIVASLAADEAPLTYPVVLAPNTPVWS